MQTRVHNPISASCIQCKEKTGQADKLSKNDSSYFAKVSMRGKKKAGVGLVVVVFWFF